MPAKHDTTPNSSYDLVVIGGGIYGAAALWEASHRGLKCLLLEKNDFASQTSANSLKTIHGGIRYLQQMHLARTYVCDKEKILLQRIAPHLITPLDCYLPSENNLGKNPFSFFCAGQLFNLISKISPDGSGRNHAIFKPAKVLRKQFFTKQQHYLYWQDAQVSNSEHLVLSFIESAQQLGAHAFNYCSVSQVEIQKDRTIIEYEFQETDKQTQRIESSFVVDCSNCTQHLPQSYGDSPPSSFVTGMNLVLDMPLIPGLLALPSYNSKLNKQGMLTFSAWKNTTIVGTWYFKQCAIQDKSQIKESILANCVQDIRLALQQAGLEYKTSHIYQSILDCHIGKIPADTSIRNPEKSIINTAIHHTLAPHYLQLRGNKYTTARLNAVKAIDYFAQIRTDITPSQSHYRALTGFAAYANGNYSDNCIKKLLSERYGQNANTMLHSLSTPHLKWLDQEHRISTIEVDFFAQQQTSHSLADLLYRRLNLNPHLHYNPSLIKKIGRYIADSKKWSNEKTQREINAVNAIENAKRNLSISP